MARFSLMLRLLAPVFVLVGMAHLVLGLGADAALGAAVPGVRDATLDSQDRFYGVMFAGYGPLLWVAAGDPRRLAVIVRVTAGFMMLGGLARLISMLLYGALSWPVTGLLLVELIAPAGLLWWHRRLLQSCVSTAGPAAHPRGV